MSRHLGGYLLFAAASVSLWAADIPVARSVEPRNGAPGTTLMIKGDFLDKEKVDEVYLTDHRFDLKVKVIEQDVNHLKIRIPPFAKPGRHQLLFLAKGTNTTVYLEQPVYIQVEEAVEAAATPAPAPAPASAGTPDPPPSPLPAVAESRVVQPQFANPDATKPQKREGRKREDSQPKRADQRQLAAVSLPLMRPEPAPPVEPPPAVVQTEAATPAPAPAAPATPVQVVKQSPPAYPQIAQRMRISGVVSLEVVVSADGNVERVKVVEGHPLLNDAAAKAVKSWGYRAATLQGQPVAGTIPIQVRFNLP